MKSPPRTAVVVLLCVVTSAAQTAWAEALDWRGMQERAVGVLRHALAEEQEWVRVHAAEALLKHGYTEGVEEAYLPQVETAPPKHRIGVWRVLAQAQEDEASREEYVARIRAAFLDVNGADRIHAAETLGKLGDKERPEELVRVTREETGALQVYARFALANSRDPEDEAALAELLTGDVRGSAAYGLRFQPRLRSETLAKLRQALEVEAEDSDARIYMVSALYVHSPEETRDPFRPALVQYAHEGNKGQKYEAGAALGLRGTESDVPLLLEMLEDAETDVRISAADALLSIQERLHSKEGLKLSPYSYHESFEGESPSLSLWAKNGESTIAFNGPSEEEASEGTRSLKLDVTLNSGSYHYFGVPLRVPCAGNVKMSARVFVAEGTTARVGFGTNMVYPRTHHSGCGAIRKFEKPTGEWELVEVDLVARGEAGAAKVVENNTADTRGEDVGAYLDKWSLFVYGGEGRRAVVYVDDLRVEGEIPSEADYEQELDRRWAAKCERLQGQIREWREQLATARVTLENIPDPPEEVRDDVESIKAGVGEVEQRIDKLDQTGYGAKGDFERIEQELAAIRYGPETIAAIVEGVTTGLPYLIYTPPAITNAQMTSQSATIPARISNGMTCAGCRGEYESMTALVYALDDVSQMRVAVSDLRGDWDVIPSQAVDTFLVKCWYQAGKPIQFKPGEKLLVPELLLRDDKLVRVDLEAEENYVRSTAEDGTETYLNCSSRPSDHLKDVRPIDAKELQPVDIAARGLQQFWFTVRIPNDAKPGVYQGEVTFTTSNGSRSLPLAVTVHTFDLLPSRLTYSIYYRAKLSEDGKPTIGSEYKSEEQFRAELEDMLAHGVPYPTNYQQWVEPHINRVLDLRHEVGLPVDRFYNLGRTTGSPDSPGEMVNLRQAVASWVEKLHARGYQDIYFYGIDEARGDRLKAQRDAWRAVQEAGGRTFVACYTKTFEAMGELLDCAVLAGRPDPKEAEKWHSVGSEAFCYAYPQVGNEEPETYRRNFGLVLWKAGFDGAMDYAYQHGFNHVWNDFDSDSYRDHNFTYPTVNGVVGTIQWEGFREAVDDVRYMTTLEDAVAKAPASKAKAVETAQRFISQIEPDTGNLYATREEIVVYIEALR